MRLGRFFLVSFFIVFVLVALMLTSFQAVITVEDPCAVAVETTRRLDISERTWSNDTRSPYHGQLLTKNIHHQWKTDMIPEA